MMGYDFDRQRPIDEFIVDFYCKQLMLAIEIDGYSHDSEEAQKRDRERQARLESLGVRFLRFTEEDAKHHVEGVLEVIQAWILQNVDLVPLQGGVRSEFLLQQCRKIKGFCCLEKN